MRAWIKEEVACRSKNTRGGTGLEPGRLQTEESYGVPEGEEDMLPWSHVEERMLGPRNYWVATVRPDGRPHAVPVWGVWLMVPSTLAGGGARVRRTTLL